MATKEDYQVRLISAWACAHFLMDTTVIDLFRQADKAQAIGPILDPTLYRDNAGKLGEDRDMLRILNDARRDLLKRFRDAESLAK